MFKTKKQTLILYVIFVFLLLWISSLIPRLRAPFLNILKPPLNLLTLARREFNGIIFYHRNFIQNEKLKNQIDFLRNKLDAQSEIYQENIRLKNLLSFKQKSPYRLVAARVIGRPADSWSSCLVIDKGRYNGIRRNMAAITYSGLAGRVIEVQEFTSKILLITDPNFSVSSIAQRSRQEGLVSGTLGVNLIMKYLPEYADIKIGDSIITSGFNETYPKGLSIGTVAEVAREYSGLGSYAVIRPAVNLSSIEDILIIVQ